jgi:heme/copper-type cytochrome/quinol oxidase subunit 2
MESFRRQLATGQTSVMDWDIIYMLCIFALVLLFFFGCVCVSVCAAEYRKKKQRRDQERHRGGTNVYKEECLVYKQRD